MVFSFLLKIKREKIEFWLKDKLKKDQQMTFFVFLADEFLSHFCNVKSNRFTLLIRQLMYRNLLLTSFFMLLAVLASGQGWERVYFGGGQDEVLGLSNTPDGGFVMAGNYNGTERLYLIKTDADGNMQWNRRYLPPTGDFRISGLDIRPTSDGNYVVTGWTGQVNRNILLAKIDATGNLLWLKSFDTSSGMTEEGQALLEMPNGDLVVAGFQSNMNGVEDLLVLRTDPNGNLLWAKTFGAAGEPEKGYGLTLANNGDIVVAGEYRNNTFANKDIYIVRLNEAGELIWENTYGLFGTFDEIARDVVSLDDDSFVLAGSSNFLQGGGGLLMKIAGNGDDAAVWFEVYPQTQLFSLTRDLGNGFFAAGLRSNSGLDDLFILHADATGNRIWEAVVGKGGPDVANAVVATPDGGAAAAGYSQPFVLSFEQAPYLVKTDSEGRIFTSYLQGNVFLDLDANCLQDAGEEGLEDWIIKVASTNFTRYIAADQDGNFLLAVDTGDYQITLIEPNNLWQTCNNNAISVQVPAFYDTVAVAVPVRGAVNCPRNEVDIQTALLRRCADNIYTVRYCNSGTVPSLNTRIEITADPALTVTGSSIPWSQQSGQVYTFAVGTLNPGECKTFTVTAFLDCDAQIGTAHCMKAHIRPDSFCVVNPDWDGSIVVAEAICDAGQVKLLLRNKGVNPMANELGFVIAEDLIMLTPPGDPDYRFKLGAGGDTLVFQTPANGKTYRVIAEQSPGYPGLSYPTAAVEGCVTDTTADPISTGFYTMFPDDEADVFVAVDCQETYETEYNPTFLKRGHPKGYDVSNFISPQTDLEFLIRFVNSGTDTVQQVIVRDTLAAELDPGTVFPGAASHPYDFQVYGNGIVQFTIPNANLLPDGSSASEGFVSFRVSQAPDLPCGAEVLNTAAVYFDYNAPAFTNETFHTVCQRDSFLVVDTKDILIPGATVKVYPNPFLESAQFEITGIQASSYRLEVYDIQGRLQFNQFFVHPTFRLFRHQIPSGAHFYRLVADGKPVASGKIIAN